MGSSRWRTDDLYVYGGPAGEVALAWRVQMSDTSGPRWIASHARDLGYAAQHVNGFVTLTSGIPGGAWTWDGFPPECAFP